MRPYKLRKLTDSPDVADIHEEGRASRDGRLDDRSYMSPSNKAIARRRLKRIDRAAQIRQEHHDE